MTFDPDKAFDVDNGIVLHGENGVGLFSGNGTPSGTQAPQGSYYFNSVDGAMWYKHGAGVNDWRTVNPEFSFDHYTILTAPNTGIEFNSATYEVISNGHIAAFDEHPNNTTWVWCISGYKSAGGGGSVDLRVYDVTNAQELGFFNFTETVPTLKSAVLTTQPTGDTRIELQGRRIGGGGVKGIVFSTYVSALRNSL